ncbi:hypothetical protein [Microbacterium testaceum]|uniref:hypothetical protein n=1 Tax=Microbacterium testaceum TaxID=2033 RepID=UPI002AC690BB|nr:hypothetical protein [Microbacterium testaceum]MDZ5144494.1 hypothetical protein [Microbacterium testaceum]
MGQSIERLRIAVDRVSHALGPLEHADDLRRQILAAVHAGGGFLTVTTDDGSKLSILVTSATSVTISVVTVHLQEDTADAHQAVWAPPPFSYDDDDTPFDVI